MCTAAFGFYTALLFASLFKNAVTLKAVKISEAAEAIDS